ncbi:MAG: alkaline shock response membrane anchor protein AmaP [Dehalococcoidia bacterium]|nr:alkaline shock response membrane anchor protein AmaP [Dehalococcoidia bacterium]
MNLLARFFLTIYGLLLISACGGLVALSFAEDEKLDVSIGDYNLQALVITSDGARIAVTVILAAVALLGAISVLLAFLPWRRRDRDATVKIQRGGGGTVEITTNAVERTLADELRPLPGVREVSPVVRVRGGTVETEITLSIDPGASIADVTSTVSEATGQVLREQIGATQVRRPTIRITYDEIQVRHPATTRPVTPPEGPLPPPPPSAVAAARWPHEEHGEEAAGPTWEPPRNVPEPDDPFGSEEPEQVDGGETTENGDPRPDA